MARSVILQPSQSKTIDQEYQTEQQGLSLKSTVVIIDSQKKPNTDENVAEVMPNENVLFSSTLPNPNSKEKRRTVKEMISKFEPK